MNSGLTLLSAPSLALTQGTAIIVFTEETGAQLYTAVLRRAAAAEGIDAMATRAIDTGDFDSIDMIQAAASEMAEALKDLACMIGQMKPSTTA